MELTSFLELGAEFEIPPILPLPGAAATTTIMEQTKIKIWHTDYTHLQKSRTNKAFLIYNNFLNLTLKNKNKVFNAPYIISYGKAMGI